MKQIFILGEQTTYANYANALAANGATPVCGTRLDAAANCHGLLLVGGADVNPQLYHATNSHSQDIDNIRDTIELALVKIFLSKNKPVFGICRGIQLINVALGGSLIQHVSHPTRHSQQDQPTDKIHLVRCMTHSFLTDLYGSSYTVNSAHHQAIKTLAPDLELLACAEDGIVEAVQHKTKPLFAVQWHPERMSFVHKRADTVDGAPLFSYFLSL